jgi:1-aminocyclopropane-1-carboxylate deaminase/D-cysteine desulfhydrase-like pyridoxal-dependent ACC family enzyme
MVRDDLREIELRCHATIEQVRHLLDGPGVRVRPAAKGEAWLNLPDALTQLPRVCDASRRPQGLVPAKHHERREPVLRGTIRIRETVVQGMLASQEWDDGRPGHVLAQVDHEMAKIVFLFHSDRAVREEHERTAARQAAHRMVGIDPRVHACRRFELRARRTQLRRDDGCTRSQGFDEGGQSDQYTERFMPVAPTLPSLPLATYVTPVEELARLRAALGGGPRLLIKRDDAIPFAFGGNKVRKMRLVGADAVERGADTLITAGGVQSNHARVTAATAARLGIRCILVVNGSPPQRATANALLDALLGADVRYVATRQDRALAMEQIAGELLRAGRRPYVIPVGASTPLGAAAFAQAVEELIAQGPAPDAIVHATSSGGTQSGLIAGCVKAGLPTRIIGVSADESSPSLVSDIRTILNGVSPLIGMDRGALEQAHVEVDDRFVGDGYGVPTPGSQEALELTARTEAIFLDHTYTAKAMAGLIARVRGGEFREDQTVLFWHTGGQVALFQ